MIAGCKGESIEYGVRPMRIQTGRRRADAELALALGVAVDKVGVEPQHGQRQWRMREVTWVERMHGRPATRGQQECSRRTPRKSGWTQNASSGPWMELVESRGVSHWYWRLDGQGGARECRRSHLGLGLGLGSNRWCCGCVGSERRGAGLIGRAHHQGWRHQPGRS
ncbi:hypothetical protein BCR44DRAFT_1012945 [Catenaria anguillulae PL171]|uniref:Uncharacterized protein n=1 Tax=Catenaria anguillulae PL171 TaxID=765915 RepID=A0A1Y2I4M1_9FUNG|nr:hypothetical protein BCR44DRAFT_1012945 [Catenaria anguillulae PL171]